MLVNEFDFSLPEELIALRPANPRDNAKLLYVPKNKNAPSNFKIKDIVDLLKEGDALVLNDTKVIPARLQGKRIRAEHIVDISVTLHQRKSLSSWHAFVRPAKRLKVGEEIIFTADDIKLVAKVEEKLTDGGVILKFQAEGDLWEALEKIGKMPLPPYIASKRAEDKQDQYDYQTIYANEKGAVAAPTAGLHFTEDLLQKIKQKNIKIYFITLHVGAGTFLPVKVDNIHDHKMHSEWGVISAHIADELNKVKQQGGRIVAVGTTSLRLLETAAQEGNLTAWSGNTDIFITPGYKFKFVDLLMTNFHLPKSTLFMLVSAFCGIEKIKNIYQYAINNGYRFYSYGDSSLLERDNDNQ
ncbi:tRNA preQ1(34) S-adenosylmethionine ribosyltransferase-isomerase QueA [Bartonella sp. DGB1]|uniref:tRNA preQ1(34) S-adenosylmethionine ribosyltransferase-isomerase QueA n=1 Tax=Bartonella sp. DGB1 TaxID=3239807 RepID=UPI003525EAD4